MCLVSDMCYVSDVCGICDIFDMCDMCDHICVRICVHVLCMRDV